MATCSFCGGGGWRDGNMCGLCGGTGTEPGDSPRAVSSSGNLGCILVMGVVAVVLMAPFAAVVIVGSWLPPAPVRFGAELLFPESVVVHTDRFGVDTGQPWLAVAVGAGVLAAVLIVLGVLVRRAARRFMWDGGARLTVFALALLWACAWMIGLPTLIALWAVADGRDLVPGALDDVTPYTQWWQIALVVALVLLATWVRAGLAINRAITWGERRGY